MCVRANTSTCGEMQGTFTVWDFLLLLLLACFNLSSLFIFLLRCILKADRGYVSRTYLIFVYVSVDHWVWNVWPLVSCVQTSLIAGSEFGPAACKPVKKSATVCLRVCLQSCGCVWERERERKVCVWRRRMTRVRQRSNSSSSVGAERQDISGHLQLFCRKPRCRRPSFPFPCTHTHTHMRAHMHLHKNIHTFNKSKMIHTPSRILEILHAQSGRRGQVAIEY